MHAFWLVLTHDLLEDRRIDDVIIKIFSVYFDSLLYTKYQYQILRSSVIYYWTDARQLGIYLLNIQCKLAEQLFIRGLIFWATKIVISPGEILV